MVEAATCWERHDSGYFLCAVHDRGGYVWFFSDVLNSDCLGPLQHAVLLCAIPVRFLHHLLPRMATSRVTHIQPYQKPHPHTKQITQLTTPQESKSSTNHPQDASSPTPPSPHTSVNPPSSISPQCLNTSSPSKPFATATSHPPTPRTSIEFSAIQSASPITNMLGMN